MLDTLRSLGAAKVLDLGCGEGRLIGSLLSEPSVRSITGIDVSLRALATARRRLRLDDLPTQQRERVTLLHGSLVYGDNRLSSHDAAIAMEVIEHIDAPRLDAFEEAVFGTAQPNAVLVTTPNAEYNAVFDKLSAGAFRHGDHRFEWTRGAIPGLVEAGRPPPPVRCAFPGHRSCPPGPWGTNPDGCVYAMKIAIPELCLVVLIGPTGSGKSTFAARHFKPTEVVSSDTCRAMVADDDTDQSATPDAFALLNFIAATRLRAGRLTVIDATSVQPRARKPLVGLAREHDCLSVAIVLNMPEALCLARNKDRPERAFGPHVVRNQASQLKRSLRRLKREGFRYVFVLNSPEEVEEAFVERMPMWVNLRNEHGPFDIIGDVHGCFDELAILLKRLGYRLETRADDIGGSRFFRHPSPGAQGRIRWRPRGPGSDRCQGTRSGDVHDRGRHRGFAWRGNHEAKLVRKLQGRKVQISHGLAESLAQLEMEPPEFQQRAAAFLDGLISHYVFDDGNLVVAHAGLKADYQGRASAPCPGLLPVWRDHRGNGRIRSPGTRRLGRPDIAGRRWWSTVIPRSWSPLGSTAPSTLIRAVSLAAG